jgi:hypothetical protein
VMKRMLAAQKAGDARRYCEALQGRARFKSVAMAPGSGTKVGDAAKVVTSLTRAKLCGSHQIRLPAGVPEQPHLTVKIGINAAGLRLGHRSDAAQPPADDRTISKFDARAVGQPDISCDGTVCEDQSPNGHSASDIEKGRVTAFLRLDRRNLVWINVTANPTAEWIACQLTDAFPWNEAPRYMIRDRDRIYGALVTRRLRSLGIRDKPTAPASPWQNRFAERLIGSIRRECLDHIVVLGEAHLRRILRSYARYYNDIRTHRSLDKDAPAARPVQRAGSIKTCPILGGLHHHYLRV